MLLIRYPRVVQLPVLLSSPLFCNGRRECKEEMIWVEGVGGGGALTDGHSSQSPDWYIFPKPPNYIIKSAPRAFEILISAQINAADMSSTPFKVVASLNASGVFPVDFRDNVTDVFNVTDSVLKNFTSTEPSNVEVKYVDDGSIIAKITLLLVVTAVVLIASYKFVVRLFLGYADRKDEVVPDDFSDDEDSAVVKRDIGPGDYEEMGHFG
ncbi:hypothetical protein Btru_003643 [Bulinus truncatus]|nr:hypothetical protein Btru_003643 [Bulinus truncatus]